MKIRFKEVVWREVTLPDTTDVSDLKPVDGTVFGNAKEFFDQLKIDPEKACYPIVNEYDMQTAEQLTPQENKGKPTIEVYVDGKMVMSN